MGDGQHSRISIRPLTDGEAEEIRGWRYPPPYDVYDEGEPTAASTEMDDGSSIRALVRDGELVGFCSFGADARVPGGTYTDGPIDVGMGLRPDLTGAGLGTLCLAAALELAGDLGATAVRATVAEFNQRALRLCERAGFRRVARFDGAERPFVILIRESAR
jgi:[ribosomal protein S18]-alanine N-acetyltransferase